MTFGLCRIWSEHFGRQPGEQATIRHYTNTANDSVAQSPVSVESTSGGLVRYTGTPWFAIYLYIAAFHYFLLLNKGMASSSKKRKVSDECRVFQERWTDAYLFVEVSQKPICLVCNESVAVMKEYNLKRHYETKHAANFNMFQGQVRCDKVCDLKKKLKNQQFTFKKPSIETEACVKVSYAIAEKIAKKSKPFIEGEFIKECMESAADILCPSQKQLFSKISLSASTISRRIDDMAGDIDMSLMHETAEFVFYSIALDESTDVSDTAQLAIFIRGINNNFKITEELLSLYPMKGTTQGTDLFQSVMEVLNKFNLELTNLAGIATDGCPSMVGKNKGVVALIQKHKDNDSVLHYHCIIHQQHLCSKAVGFENVMNVVIKVVNFIRSHGLKHRQFQNLLAELNSDHQDVPYFCDVRWLSRGKMLERVFELKDPIKTFMINKEKPVDEFNDPTWVSDLAFCADITMHLNILNQRLQNQDNLIHNLFDCVKSFEMKLDIWKNQLKNFDLTHFEKLSQCEGYDMNKYVTALDELKEGFSSRFSDFRKNEQLIDLFARPFSFNVNDAPGNMQMELTDLQCNSELKEKYKLGLLEFYSKYIDKDNFPNIRMHALKMMSLFGSTYLCEQLFSRMNFVKNKSRSRLTDAHLQNSLKVSISSIRPNIDKLVKNTQCQTSH